MIGSEIRIKIKGFLQDEHFVYESTNQDGIEVFVNGEQRIRCDFSRNAFHVNVKDKDLHSRFKKLFN